MITAFRSGKGISRFVARMQMKPCILQPVLRITATKKPTKQCPVSYNGQLGLLNCGPRLF
jgi:hypothetical protein